MYRQSCSQKVQIPVDFDWEFYCSYYNDLRLAGIDSRDKAVDHYLRHGHLENRIYKSSTLLESFSPKTRSFFDIDQQYCLDFHKIAGFSRSAKILEIGCGIGRFAIPLTNYLNSSGHYTGVDISKTCVSWCQNNVKSSNGNFQFARLVSTIENDCQKIIFPSDNETYDFIFSSTQLTLLKYEEVHQFLKEIDRVLKPGGICLINYFLWNHSIDGLIKKNLTDIRSVIKVGHSDTRALLNSLKEKVFSYSESLITKSYQSTRLKIREVFYGYWSGSSQEPHYSDIIIAEKI
jgi:ubiquinone/menaquinone biosynthesis C-methylase UbiE